MSEADELAKLAELHARGQLSDDEFARAKARLLSGAPTAAAPFVERVNSLRRSREDRWLGGVCGGLAEITGLAAWIWRLIAVLLVLFGGTGLLLYVLLWVFVPEAPLRTPVSSAPGH